MDLEKAEKLLRKAVNETNHKRKAWLRARDRYVDSEKRRSDAVGVMLAARASAAGKDAAA